MKISHACLFSLAAPLTLACSSSSATTSDAGHSTSPVDGGVTGGGDASDDAPPPCNSLAASAPVVNYSLSNDGTPAAQTGGTIADGTYYLTSYTIYGAGSVGGGFTADQATSLTVQVSGQTWNQIQVFQIEGTTATVTTNYALSTTTSSLSLTPSCPAGADPVSGTFTATATDLQVVTSTGGFTLSEVFAKQ